MISATGIARIIPRVKHRKIGPKMPDYLEHTPEYHSNINRINTYSEPGRRPIIGPAGYCLILIMIGPFFKSAGVFRRVALINI